MGTKKYKLYVWEDVLSDYTSGIAFAVAKSPEEAREKVMKVLGGGSYLRDELAGAPGEYELDTSPGFALYGGS